MVVCTLSMMAKITHIHIQTCDEVTFVFVSIHNLREK